MHTRVSPQSLDHHSYANTHVCVPVNPPRTPQGWSHLEPVMKAWGTENPALALMTAAWFQVDVLMMALDDGNTSKRALTLATTHSHSRTRLHTHTYRYTLPRAHNPLTPATSSLNRHTPPRTPLNTATSSSDAASHSSHRLSADYAPTTRTGRGLLALFDFW